MQGKELNIKATPFSDGKHDGKALSALFAKYFGPRPNWKKMLASQVIVMFDIDSCNTKTINKILLILITYYPSRSFETKYLFFTLRTKILDVNFTLSGCSIAQYSMWHNGLYLSTPFSLFIYGNKEEEVLLIHIHESTRRYTNTIHMNYYYYYCS